MSKQAERINSLAANGLVEPPLDGVRDFAELPDTLMRSSRGEICGKAVVRVS